MSLEQALIDATAAITRLTTVLVSASESGAVTAPAAEKTTRAKKSVEPVAQAAQVAQAEAPVAVVSVIRYFHIPAHNTVYKQLPGMADCSIQGAVEVSEAEYEVAKAELEKKFPTASAAATPAPVTSAPTATAQPVLAYTFEQVVEKLRAMHKTQGDTGVAKVLAHFGVSRVPELNGKVKNSDVVEFIATVGA